MGAGDGNNAWRAPLQWKSRRHRKHTDKRWKEMVQQNFVMTASRKDTKPAKRLQVGDMSVNPEKITIRGRVL